MMMNHSITEVAEEKRETVIVRKGIARAFGTWEDAWGKWFETVG